MGWFVRLAFARLSRLLPVRRVVETDAVLGFEHPAPAWSPHILFVPKRSVRSFRQIRPAQAALFGRMVRLAFSVAATRGLYRDGFAVMINGGAYQDVAQAHLHLAGLDAGLTYDAPPTRPERLVLEADGLIAFEHPRARRAAHLVILPSEALRWQDLDDAAIERLGVALVGVGQRLVARSAVLAAGFTLLASVRPGGTDAPVCFHLVGGDRRESEA